MILCLTAHTDLPDMVIDYIEVRLATGKTVSLTWDESEYGLEEGVFTARYKGVYFDEDYANGRLDELCGMKIDQIGVYTECGDIGKAKIEITAMTFDDNGFGYEPKCLPLAIAVKECERT